VAEPRRVVGAPGGSVASWTRPHPRRPGVGPPGVIPIVVPDPSSNANAPAAVASDDAALVARVLGGERDALNYAGSDVLAIPRHLAAELVASYASTTRSAGATRALGLLARARLGALELGEQLARLVLGGDEPERADDENQEEEEVQLRHASGSMGTSPCARLARTWRRRGFKVATRRARFGKLADQKGRRRARRRAARRCARAGSRRLRRRRGGPACRRF